MAHHKGHSSGGWKDLRDGAVLQCAEAATLGMPFEVWKTRMGRFRNESTITAFKNVYRSGGVLAFYSGLSPKLVESASKGAILLWSKELIKDLSISLGLSPTAAGFLAGAGGGVCQVTVMGPCTFLVTAVVTATNKDVSTLQRIRDVWAKQGIKGFYPGGTAIAFRQATNWASRQGFTDAIRYRLKLWRHGDINAKLSVAEESLAGIIGGALSCWNQPFEVARIEMQARGASGETKLSMLQVFRLVWKESGVLGLFKGVIPRIGLGIWQTLFMVSGANILRDWLAK